MNDCIFAISLKRFIAHHINMDPVIVKRKTLNTDSMCNTFSTNFIINPLNTKI